MLANDEHLLEADHRVTPPGHVSAVDFTRLLEHTRAFQNLLAGALLKEEDIDPIVDGLTVLSDRLVERQVPDGEQDVNNRFDVAARGQCLTPPFTVIEMDRNHLVARIEFGRWFVGRVSAHGGTIPLVIDDMLGMLAGAGGRPPARTAYLNVDFKTATPVETSLDFEAWIVFEKGRKRLLKAELRHGETVCATAESLFVAVRTGAW
jgi:hypothetical protein